MTLPDCAELERRTAELLAQWRVVHTAVRVLWNDRLTTTAGRAFLRNGCIELNPTLLVRAPDQIPVVLTHEAAHIAAFRLFGANIPAHGRHWRSLMRLAGLPPDVTHKMPVTKLRRGRRRYVYLRVCDACGARSIQPSVRYGRCHGCSARDRFLVMKAPANALGRAALERLSLADVRASFG
ncbi:MAG: SprT family zinc-dependent metalloprotease [Planctomycetota bacterium]